MENNTQQRTIDFGSSWFNYRGSSEIRQFRDLNPDLSGFQSQDETITQKDLTQKCGRITSTSTLILLLKTGRLVWGDSINLPEFCGLYTILFHSNRPELYNRTNAIDITHTFLHVFFFNMFLNNYNYY